MHTNNHAQKEGKQWGGHTGYSKEFAESPAPQGSQDLSL